MNVETLKQFVNNKNLSSSSVIRGIFNHNKELSNFCSQFQEIHSNVFRNKSEALIFLAKDMKFQKCKNCQKPLTYSQMRDGIIFCSNKCAKSSTEFKVKFKETMLKKYGVESPFQADEVKIKTK